ncbi:hypothetical protein M0802_009142 [Mischocyttarus mexicanus]|nr:hypothetical protein M0802_009142 [Mischocyttarus mexicanus]
MTKPNKTQVSGLTKYGVSSTRNSSTTTTSSSSSSSSDSEIPFSSDTDCDCSDCFEGRLMVRKKNKGKSKKEVKKLKKSKETKVKRGTKSKSSKNKNSCCNAHEEKSGMKNWLAISAFHRNVIVPKPLA